MPVMIPAMPLPCPAFGDHLSFHQRMSDSLRSLDALRQPKTHRLWLAFLGQSGKRGKETPQGTDGSLRPCSKDAEPPAGTFCQERSYALRALACIPPAKNSSPAARIFGASWKKCQKTPVETHGFHPSFARLTAHKMRLISSRNRQVKACPPCCIAASTNSLSRSPLQDVERCTSTFQSGVAAEIEAGTMPHLRRKGVCRQNAR